MKHYWINIEDNKDRYEFMTNQFNILQIENKRIDAITPKTLNNFNIIRNIKSINSNEEISCILSHLKAIKYAYDNTDDEYFCILEDDILFKKIDFKSLIDNIKKIEKDNNENIEMIQLFINSHSFIIDLYNNYYKKNEILKKRNTDDYPSTGYYLISRNGAKKLLDLFIKDDKNYDLSYHFWTAADNILYKPLNTYTLTYPVAISDISYGSIIHPSHLHNHEIANRIINIIWNNKENNYLFNHI